MKRNNYQLSKFTSSTKNRIKKMCGEDAKGGKSSLGYSEEEFLSHIESTFQPGMSWENRGKWHIDHIVPVSKYVSEGNLDIKEINKLSNLRALWANENQRRERTNNAGALIKIAKSMGVEPTVEAVNKEYEKLYGHLTTSSVELAIEKRNVAQPFFWYEQKQILKIKDLSDALGCDDFNVISSALELGLQQIKELASRNVESAQELVAMNDFKAKQ